MIFGGVNGGKRLEESLRENALAVNAIRLLLALLVLVSHAYPLGGHVGQDIPFWPSDHLGMSLGGFAVGSFFALSGLLVTISARKRSALQFLLARARRILPAYLVCLMLTSLVLAPIIYALTHQSLSGYFSLHANGPISYVVRNAAYPIGLQYGIGDVFSKTTPYGLAVGTSVINGSLWTLPLEIRCYGLALFVAIVGRRFGIEKLSFICLAFIGCSVAFNQVDPSALNFLPPQLFPTGMLELLFVFLCGCFVGANSHLIRIGSLTVTVVLSIFLLAISIGGVTFRTIGLGSICLVIPLLASKLPLKSASVLRNDLSYGAYLWSFPVQQTLSFFRINELSFVGYVLASIVLTLGMAIFSWFIVEAPALGKYQTVKRRESR